MFFGLISLYYQENYGNYQQTTARVLHEQPRGAKHAAAQQVASHRGR